MWLTDFDAPCMHTLYIDKPMQGHGLVQVNRVLRDKPARLIVDDIGIAQNLKPALQRYSKNDQENTGVDKAQAIAVMMENQDAVLALSKAFALAEVDWAHPDSARARMRALVKRILRKYGYPPPDLQDTAVQTVLQQAEALSSAWSVSPGGSL